MKLCLAEVIKKVKALSDEVETLISRETRNCQTSYRTVEEKIDTGYNFDDTRKQIADLQDQVLKLKALINKANLEIKIGVRDYTISDGLIKMAQISKEIAFHLDCMVNRQKLTSQVDSRNDAIIYTEQLYDIDECTKYVQEQIELRQQIQMGIDRANLNTFIEV